MLTTCIIDPDIDFQNLNKLQRHNLLEIMREVEKGGSILVDKADFSKNALLNKFKPSKAKELEIRLFEIMKHTSRGVSTFIEIPARWASSIDAARAIEREDRVLCDTFFSHNNGLSSYDFVCTLEKCKESRLFECADQFNGEILLNSLSDDERDEIFCRVGRYSSKIFIYDKFIGRGARRNHDFAYTLEYLCRLWQPKDPHSKVCVEIITSWGDKRDDVEEKQRNKVYFETTFLPRLRKIHESVTIEYKTKTTFEHGRYLLGEHIGCFIDGGFDFLDRNTKKAKLRPVMRICKHLSAIRDLMTDDSAMR